MNSPSDPHPLLKDYVRYETRRQFFRRGASFIGSAALGMLAPQLLRAGASQISSEPMLPKVVGPHFPAKAKQVIYLHMVGGPPQMDLFDYKPVMRDYYDKDLPESVRQGQR